MNDLPPTARVMQVLMGVMNSAAVLAIARLGIPDHLHSGPKTVEELAHAVGAKPELLFRLMRATAGLGILVQTRDRRLFARSRSVIKCRKRVALSQTGETLVTRRRSALARMAGQKPCRPQFMRIAVLLGLVAGQRY